MATEQMVCLYCRKKIGLVRSLTDRSFCCGEHRKKYRSKSARALRESEDLFGFDEVSWRALTHKPEEKTERRAGYGATLFFAVVIVAVLLGMSQLRSGAPGGRAASPAPTPNLSASQGGFGRAIGNLLESKGS